MIVRKVQPRLSPQPALGGPHYLGLGGEFFEGEPVEQSRVLEPALSVLAEQVAADSSPCRLIGLGPDQTRTAVGSLDLMLGHHPADEVGRSVVGQVAPDLFLPGVVLADGEGHQLVEGYLLGAIGGHQDRADRAKAQPPLYQGRRDAEPRPDLLGAPPLGVRQLAEGLELVGGMHGETGDVFVETDLEGVIVGVEQAADGLGLGQTFAFGQEPQGQPTAFANGNEVITRLLAFTIAFGLDHGRLQHPLGGDGGGERLDVGCGVRGPPRIARGLLEPVEGDEDFLPTLGGESWVDRHGGLLLGLGCGRKAACTPARRRDQG